MADLAKALAPVLEAEGGFVNDPDDAGGMTYRGIARTYHPDWGGWEIIDAWLKQQQPINDAILAGLVERFYRTEFWGRFQGDKIRDQVLAGELLDQAVHLGVHRAVEHLQRALNALNNQGKRWADMERDGKLGPSTLAAIDTALTDGLGRHLITAIRCQQGVYYLERMEKRPVTEKYSGWFSRV